MHPIVCPPAHTLAVSDFQILGEFGSNIQQQNLQPVPLPASAFFFFSCLGIIRVFFLLVFPLFLWFSQKKKKSFQMVFIKVFKWVSSVFQMVF